MNNASKFDEQTPFYYSILEKYLFSLSLLTILITICLFLILAIGLLLKKILKIKTCFDPLSSLEAEEDIELALASERFDNGLDLAREGDELLKKALLLEGNTKEKELYLRKAYATHSKAIKIANREFEFYEAYFARAQSGFELLKFLFESQSLIDGQNDILSKIFKDFKTCLKYENVKRVKNIIDEVGFSSSSIVEKYLNLLKILDIQNQFARLMFLLFNVKDFPHLTAQVLLYQSELNYQISKKSYKKKAFEIGEKYIYRAKFDCTKSKNYLDELTWDHNTGYLITYDSVNDLIIKINQLENAYRAIRIQNYLFEVSKQLSIEQSLDKSVVTALELLKKYKETLCLIKDYDLKFRAQLLAEIGFIYGRYLRSKETSMDFFNDCDELIKKLNISDEVKNSKWFTNMELCKQYFKDIDEEKKDLEKDIILELNTIDTEMPFDSYRELVRYFYTKYPPKCDNWSNFDYEKLLKPKLNLKQVVSSAIRIYHPDRNREEDYGKKWHILCKHIEEKLVISFRNII